MSASAYLCCQPTRVCAVPAADMIPMSRHLGQGSHQTRQTELDEIWGDLRRGIEHVYSCRSMSKRRYVQLYTLVYNYCTSVQQQQQPNSRASSAKAKKGNACNSGAQIVGNELYKRLRDFFKTYLMQLLRVSSEKCIVCGMPD